MIVGILNINRKGIKDRVNENDHGGEERVMIGAVVTRRNVVIILITDEGKRKKMFN